MTANKMIVKAMKKQTGGATQAMKTAQHVYGGVENVFRSVKSNYAKYVTEVLGENDVPKQFEDYVNGYRF